MRYFLPIVAALVLLDVSAAAQVGTVFDITFTPKETSQAAEPAAADPAVGAESPSDGDTAKTADRDKSAPSAIAQAPGR